MNNNRVHKILSWNVRGINCQEKWDAIRDKIVESACNIIYLQETKRENFDSAYLRKFAQGSWTALLFLPLQELLEGFW